MSSTDPIQTENKTDFRYAIIAGWLILPAIGIVASFFNTLLFLLNYSPTYLLVNYSVNILFAIFYFVIIICWIKRKKVLPQLMVISYVLNILWRVFLTFQLGTLIEYVLVFTIIDLIWIGYFTKSKRVKTTFVVATTAGLKPD